MSWSMFSIGWLEVDEVEKAEEAFKKNFDHVANEFQVYIILYKFFDLQFVFVYKSKLMLLYCN